ncbi:Uncharacterized protein GY17_00003961, partial [Cryptosporidium hominis]
MIDGNSGAGVEISKTFSVWHLFNKKIINNVVATTTTTSTTSTTTEQPWHEIELDECPLELKKPCKGHNAIIKDSQFNKGNLIWISMKTVKSTPEIELAPNKYWHGFSFYNQQNEKVLSILFNETHLLLEDKESGMDFSSRYTNSSLNYVGETITIGLGWSRLGLFLINENKDSFIEVKNNLDYTFVKIVHDSTQKSSSNYYLEENFLYPNIFLFKGYETCGLYEECSTSPVNCYSQVLTEICPKKVPGMYWTFENLIHETNVNNGTWGSEFILDGLLNVYLINDGDSDIATIYFFNNRMVLLDSKNKVACSGPYPNNHIINVSDKMKWSIGFGKNYLLYLNVYDLNNNNKEYSVCTIQYGSGFFNIEYVYPLGYAPSMSKFNQYKDGFPNGGYESTSDSTNNNGGFYYPDKDENTGEIKPEDKYGVSYPFFPPGVQPGPIDGDENNTPPGYHYNTTTGQFENDEGNTNSDLENPSRPTHIVDGISECNLYLFSTCNGTSAKIMPEDTTFNEDWTLFVILSTGVPEYGDNSNNIVFNYKYNFVKTDSASSDDIILSLSFTNNTVTFKNEKTSTESVVGSPQCGPYCSTYPKGYFAFWLTYNSATNKYIISVENNTKKLVEIEADITSNSVFNKITPVIDTNGVGIEVSKTFNIWQLTNIKEIPADTATTTTTTTTSTTSTTTTTTTTEKPWYEIELDECPVKLEKPCRGLDAVINDPEFQLGNLLWIQLKMEVSNPLIEENGRKYWMGYNFHKDTKEVMKIRLNETHILLQDQLNNKDYSSPLTNSSLGYIERELTIGIGWSRLGLFIINDDHNSYIDIKGRDDYSFNKIEQILNPDKKASNYILEDSFLYPINIMYLGYETCSLFSDCSQNTVHCGSQVLKEICTKRIPNMEWTFEGLNAETNVNNGTWGEELKMDELMNLYIVNSGEEEKNIFGVYIFKNRMALQDFENFQSCSGIYPKGKNLSFSDKMKWSLGLDSDNLVYLNYIDIDDNTKYTVCVLKHNPGFTKVKYIHPLGYSPSYMIMTQTKNGLDEGGYLPSSTPNTGFYNPEKDDNGIYKPSEKYGESYP